MMGPGVGVGQRRCVRSGRLCVCKLRTLQSEILPRRSRTGHIAVAKSWVTAGVGNIGLAKNEFPNINAFHRSRQTNVSISETTSWIQMIGHSGVVDKFRT